MAYHITISYNNGYSCSCCRDSWTQEFWENELKDAEAHVPDWPFSGFDSGITEITVIDGSNRETVAMCYWKDKEQWTGYTSKFHFEHSREYLKAAVEQKGSIRRVNDKKYSRTFGTRTMYDTDGNVVAENVDYEVVKDPEGNVLDVTWEELKAQVTKQQAEWNLAWAKAKAASAAKAIEEAEALIKSLETEADGA